MAVAQEELRQLWLYLGEICHQYHMCDSCALQLFGNSVAWGRLPWPHCSRSEEAHRPPQTPCHASLVQVDITRNLPQCCTLLCQVIHPMPEDTNLLRGNLAKEKRLKIRRQNWLQNWYLFLASGLSNIRPAHQKNRSRNVLLTTHAPAQHLLNDLLPG